MIKLVDTQADSDAQEVSRLLASGERITDPELRRRVQARSEKQRAELLKLHGVTDIAVELLRESRNEE